VPPRFLLWAPWRYGYNDFPETGRTMSFAIGVPHLTALAVALLGWPTWRRRLPAAARHFTLAALVVSIAAALLTTPWSRPIWERVGMLHYLQFPWRYLMLVAAGTSLLAAVPISLVPARRRFAVAAVVAGVFAAAGYGHARPAGFLDLREADLTPAALQQMRLEGTSIGELRPSWVESAGVAAVGGLRTRGGPVRIDPLPGSSTRRRLAADAAAEAILTSNVHFFPGWGVWLDGRLVPLAVTRPEGRIEFPLPPGRHTVELRFRRTRLRLLADALSLCGIALACLLAARARATASRTRR